MILCVVHKKAMQETGLWNIKLSLMCVTYLCCPVHDNHAQSTFVGWRVLRTYPYPTQHFYVMGLKDVFENPFQD